MATQDRRIENWRRDVAELCAPSFVRSNDRSFRNGDLAPVQVYVDDGSSLKSAGARTSTRDSRPRPVPRRASSDHGGYSRRTGRRSPERTITRTPNKGSGAYSRRNDYDRYDRYDSSSKPSTSIWSTLLPSSRSSRSRTVVYDKPSRSSLSPEYTTRRADPEVTVYSRRPQSVYAPTRAPTKDYTSPRSDARRAPRRGSTGVDDRMRLLEIRDKFREDIEKARQSAAPARTSRRRDYDRRSLHY